MNTQIVARRRHARMRLEYIAIWILETSITTPEWKCFCKENKTILYCSGIKYKNQLIESKFVKTICYEEAVNAFMNAGTKTLGENFFEKIINSEDIATLTNNEDVERAKLYCDAIDPKAVTALKSLFASTILFHMMDELILKKGKRT
ncbi:hypothetical protein PMAYCL1PPCAC_13617 [Pristionchus mayeri]|uniref:Uncharacterized protein n=1 Tax=Pristionchus mayeri TaxID=1317129 RepID=A0AAN4ZS57_9BILA|nr:hypothetical protein PMAYCL1PPCAC_13617 [Pristionchus mayeri]